MFRRLKLRIRDIRTLNALCLDAEKHAHLNSEDRPGAEHFLLAALDLPDGTARLAFKRIAADPDALRSAIAGQYAAALQGVELDTSSIKDFEPIASNSVIYDTKASGQSVMQSLATQRSKDKDTPLLSAHVLIVVASMQQGVAARSLRIMGLDQKALCAAAENEIRAFLG